MIMSRFLDYSMMIVFHLFVSLTLVNISSVVVVLGQEVTNEQQQRQPEQIFRQAQIKQRSLARTSSNPSQQWLPWSEAAIELFEVFEAAGGGRGGGHQRQQQQQQRNDKMILEAVGGFEESILAIERYIAHSGAGEDLIRDGVLSTLYTGYGKVLANLDDGLCTKLATSPHNLLIGAETADPSIPSTKLCIENAENSLRNAASLDATNQEAEDVLAKLLGKSSGVHERKPKEFVAELFDSFADTFDEKLVKGLGYKVPQLVGKAAEKFLLSDERQRSIMTTTNDRTTTAKTTSTTTTTKYRSAMDAGCGTGLAGRYLREYISGPMIGVDASQKMLDIAAQCTTSSGCGLDDDGGSTNDSSDDNTHDKTKKLYDGLFDLDLEEMTLEDTLYSPKVTTRLTESRQQKKNEAQDSTDGEKFDLIVAADVLVYFGKLDKILSKFAELSDAGAGLIFSCERADDEEAPLGWRLLPSGRFAHTKSHAVSTAEAVGYKLVHYEEIVPRMERGEEVRGHLFTFLRTSEQIDDDIKSEL